MVGKLVECLSYRRRANYALRFIKCVRYTYVRAKLFTAGFGGICLSSAEKHSLLRFWL